jgi:PhnB protein
VETKVATKRRTQLWEDKMQLNPYLIFNGQCEAAFKFYEKALGGKIESMSTWENSPMSQQVPAEWRGKIIHAQMRIGDMLLLGTDAPPERYKEPQGFSLSLGVKDVAETERIFQELVQNGKVHMAVQKTFWSARFGMLVDQFGIPWMVNCEQAAEAAAS